MALRLPVPPCPEKKPTGLERVLRTALGEVVPEFRIAELWRRLDRGVADLGSACNVGYFWGRSATSFLKFSISSKVGSEV